LTQIPQSWSIFKNQQKFSQITAMYLLKKKTGFDILKKRKEGLS